jgi:dihydrofolate reductase
MRKLVLVMQTTLNGRLDDPEAWLPGIPDDLYADGERIFGTRFDSVLVGRVTAEEMAAYWPGAETEDAPIGGLPDAPPASIEAAAINRRMARKMNAYTKYVPTRDATRTIDWRNVEMVPIRSDDDLARFVTELKAGAGRDVHLAGGAQLAQAAARLALIDEYTFNVHPVVSAGKTWFDQIGEKRELELVDVTTYSGGVVAVTYRPKASGTTKSNR